MELEGGQSSSAGGCSWADLPPELLGLVLLRVPSHANRVRFCAVCRPWRSSARLQGPLPPHLPWIALRDGTFLSLPDGAVHSMAARCTMRYTIVGTAPADDVSVRVSTGSSIFLLHGDGKRCCLTNPFSAETSHLPELGVALDLQIKIGINKIRKVVASDDFVAVQTVLRCCPAGRPRSTTSWMSPIGTRIADIALFHGKLHVLTRQYHPGRGRGLHVDLHVGNESVQLIQSYPAMIQGSSTAYMAEHEERLSYLVPSGDRLLMVERVFGPNRMHGTPRFEVFEEAGCGGWSKVDRLLGRAIFVSEGCSGSLAAGDDGTGPREDCIYFMSEYANFHYRKRTAQDDFLNSGVYSIGRSKVVATLPLDMAPPQGRWSPVWLFPTEMTIYMTPHIYCYSY